MSSIWKGSNLTTINELRPVSVLCTLSKILKKTVHKQEKNKILPTTQSAFWKHYSSTHNIVARMDMSRITYVCFFDYSKAFDVIDRELLMAKLQYYAVGDSALEWNILLLRMQFVRFNCQ